MSTSQNDNFRLDGKVALVTGSGRGIGAAIATELGKRGAKVVVNYANSSEAANKVVEEIKKNGSDAIAIKANVGQTDQVVKLMDQAVEHFGQLNIVCSNSGVVSFGHLKDVTEEVWNSDEISRVRVVLREHPNRNLTASSASIPVASSSSLVRRIII
jgi:tetrahydroxynaphthalene reductase